jgi:2-dehydro-3-deoxyphosphooctonate aldolase (KDO 8-P synthase)
MFERFLLIAGPCVLEDHGLNVEIALEVERCGQAAGIQVAFKASFDKANRARVSSARGPGLEEGLRLLARVKAETGLDVLTDVHEPRQATAAGEVVDVLQIPAFLCRQTDLLVAAARTGKPVNVKKGQWMAPEELAGAVEKLRCAGASEVAVTERGTAFGYGDLVVDMRAFARARGATSSAVLFDGTHSVQRPGRADGSSGGDREHIGSLVRAAVAAGCDGLYLETHPDPEKAPSDAASMLPLRDLEALLADVAAIRRALGARTAP